MSDCKQPEPVERLMRFAGKQRRDVSNPCLTAYESILVANYMEKQAERVRVLREALQGLEAMAERYRAPGQPMPDAQKVARAALEATPAAGREA